MREAPQQPRDWFKWFVSLCLVILAGLATYKAIESRKLQQELKRLESPRTVPLADAGRR